MTSLACRCLTAGSTFLISFNDVIKRCFHLTLTALKSCPWSPPTSPCRIDRPHNGRSICSSGKSSASSPSSTAILPCSGRAPVQKPRQFTSFSRVVFHRNCSPARIHGLLSLLNENIWENMKGWLTISLPSSCLSLPIEGQELLSSLLRGWFDGHSSQAGVPRGWASRIIQGLLLSDIVDVAPTITRH